MAEAEAVAEAVVEVEAEAEAVEEVLVLVAEAEAAAREQGELLAVDRLEPCQRIRAPQAALLSQSMSDSSQCRRTNSTCIVLGHGCAERCHPPPCQYSNRSRRFGEG